MATISIVGTSNRVVDAPGLTIDELAGNVASNNDRISIAHVRAKKGTAEPFLTLGYDEWICVLEGKILLEQGNEKPDVTASAGQTAFIKQGTRFRPSFLEDSVYVPVCLPAFRPDRCVREDGDNQEGRSISDNLKKLHAEIVSNVKGPNISDNLKKLHAEIMSNVKVESRPEVLYHMTTAAEWDEAKAKGHAYYPKTFEADGDYTHATGVPSRLIETANHFYQDVKGDWICLEFRRSALRSKFGIVVRDEEAMPVGEKGVSSEWTQQKWICPHVYGGIPLDSVDKVYAMERDGARFISIKGLTD